ncbi:hypothetical protein F5144DRAFT_493738 [Chaetomium tenue]|uniref:Uncharacterized protein n=1 Tax=Chaetomium tenue TaxID=1854479 RepID=A0ACB7P5P4_9PEZI|nr:hypothetical protein F5144DRAFT_493738 [Chaetomium globosum]
MLMQRKPLQRSSSSSSVSSTSSNSSTSTVTSNPASQPNGVPMPGAGSTDGWSNPASRKRPTPKGPWSNGKPDGAGDLHRAASGRAPLTNGINGTSALGQQQSVMSTPIPLGGQTGLGRPGSEGMGSGRQPVLYLLSLNGSFERKTISVPYYPDTLRIGRQTNAKTVPTPINGFFDSKVLSRQHAEIWADANGKIWIRDVKSSNGTFVNGTRLSPENRDSDPHELQTQDHLELGIDIVSEDQKTVVHHKVAAKVEHAGFITPTNNVLDMNFGDLESSNSAMMLPIGGVSPFRGRTGGQPGTAGNNRIVPGNMGGQMNTLAQQRQLWQNPVTTEHIVKKLHTEMRNARLQNQDLARTSQFISALLSKEDVRNNDKTEAPDSSKGHLPNGNISFRSDGGKTRFSEPPAPPPSQPLPEKPDTARASDAPSLKRGITERPKLASTSPIRQDNNLNQILLLTEALNNAKKELDSNTARVRDLEEMLTKEREARLHAEDMMQKMEETSHANMNGSTEAPPLVNGHSELDSAFEPLGEQTQAAEADKAPDSPDDDDGSTTLQQPDKAELLTAAFQARIDSMAMEMTSLKEQLEAFKLRAEKAEAERDADRKTLAEMVLQIRQRDEDEKRREAERRTRSVSKGRRRAPSQDTATETPDFMTNGSTKVTPAAENGGVPEDETSDTAPTPSRASTMKPNVGTLKVQGQQSQDGPLLHALPYVSILTVVVFGMGLMAHLNGWQPQSRLDR